MKIKIISITKKEDAFIREGVQVYLKRLKHYSPVEEIIVKAPKEKETEPELLLQKFSKEDYVVVLDENGKQFSSVDFSKWISGKMREGKRSVCFVIGGAYGFSEEIYKRANEMISLSNMTLPHQLAKLLFIEQIYRAFTIIKGEKYHHE